MDPIISAVPDLMILVIVGPLGGPAVAVPWCMALQQFDGNILGPKILGDSTGLFRHLGAGVHRGVRRAVRVPGYGPGRAHLCRAVRLGAGVGATTG
ncbi:MAG: hypothetical protein ACLRWQ_11990 [Flavonifractor plautii]